MLFMGAVPLDLFRPKPGRMRAKIEFDSLLYEIEIPLEPFDSGFDLDPRPLSTAFWFDQVAIPERDWRRLGGREFSLEPDATDGWIILGGARNPIRLRWVAFTRLKGARFRLNSQLFCDFEREGVGPALETRLDAVVRFEGLSLGAAAFADKARDYAAQHVPIAGYAARPRRARGVLFFRPRLT
jgi:hypothetical protein